MFLALRAPVAPCDFYSLELTRYQMTSISQTFCSP